MALFLALCPSVPQWAVPSQHQCLFPLTTTTFPVGSPLVVTKSTTAAIRTRITNGRAPNAVAVLPHQGVAPAPVHAAHAATQTRVGVTPPRPPTARRRRCHLLLLYLRMPKVLTRLTQALPTPRWA